MPSDVLDEAMNYLSDGARSFENVLRRAEESRVKADEAHRLAESERLEWQKKLDELNKKIEDLNREREKLNKNARTESRKIIAERTERAEELLAQMEEIFLKENISESDIIAARTLKNKLGNIQFDEQDGEKKVVDYADATKDNIKVGTAVYIIPMETRGTVSGFNPKKGEAEVICGSIKMHLKLSELKIISQKEEKAQKVKLVKHIPREQPILEINVLGLTVVEAIYEVDNFIDRAVTDNLEEIKVIHGVGTGKLKNAIAEHLKKHKNVESFCSGKYGEGETGVTFIKLK